MTAQRIALTGTFVLDTVTDTLSWWLAKLRPDATVVPAPYGQVLESLHDPTSLLRTNDGVNVVLVRPDDFLRVGDDRRGAPIADANRLLDELAAGFAAAVRHTGATWLVGILPPARSTEDVADWVAAATRRITGLVRGSTRPHLLDVDAAAELYEVSSVHDEYGDTIGHLPYTDEYLVAVGTYIARTAESIWAAPRKVIVLDCDNTLWQGVCGEDGADGVVLTEAHLWLQRFMLRQRANGRLLCLCSRNNEADVLAVFAGREDMVLRIDDVTGQRIGWGPKPDAVEALADELGLALNSFVFVDDDPVECEMMRTRLPDVTVVQVPREPELIVGSLAHEWVFDQFVVTDDDRLRADRYAEDSQRRAAAARSVEHAEFLRQCDIGVSFSPIDEHTMDRAAQLTTRTTQFNLTGEAFSVTQLEAFLGDGGLGWTVSMRDRFGDYGVVGLILAVDGEDTLEVRVLLMSCRVLNRELEQRMLGFLTARADMSGRSSVVLPYRPTERNTPARLFLEQVLGTAVEPAAATFAVSTAR